VDVGRHSAARSFVCVTEFNICIWSRSVVGGWAF